jgi:hypothetical protein
VVVAQDDGIAISSTTGTSARVLVPVAVPAVLAPGAPQQPSAFVPVPVQVH